MSLGVCLKELRMKKNASLQDVATVVEVSKSHIWELERGDTKNPSMDLLTRLANYYGVSVDYLVTAGQSEIGESPEIRTFARELAEKGLSSSDLAVLRAAADALSKK
ncbi:MAG: helix-turn-helix transcriptional regulator [Pseudohongiella sp.]|uniref:helix-turn-helix domain-containing protein n=1 Tax=Pseudohongiella sp. TaxID=1979412 RepID=UPI0034A051C7